MNSNQKLILYGRLNSSNVQKVVWVLEELKIPYERIDAGGNFDLNSKNPEYLKLNPNGLVPTINDNGFISWESNSIMRYLVRKYGKDTHEWYPINDIQKCAVIDKWLDWQNSVLYAHFGPLFRSIVRTPKDQRNPDQDKSNLEKLIQDWTLLNEHLKHHSFMAGDNFTIADVPLFMVLWRWINLPEVEKPSLPALQEYFERVKKVPNASLFMVPLS